MLNFIGEYLISQKAVNKVLEFFKNNRHDWQEGLCGPCVLDKNIKDSKDLLINPYNVPEELQIYFKELKECLESYKQEYLYAEEYQQRWEITENVSLQHYEPGGGYKVFHYESGGWCSRTLKRHLVFMTYLNTIPPEEGGGTEFFYQSVYNSVAGKTLIWPASWTHTHKGVISETQEKNIITGWYSYVMSDF